MERVMQILPVIIAIFALLSAVSAVDGNSSDFLTPSQFITLTKIETATVTLTIPPSTVTETVSMPTKDFITLRTVTETRPACTNPSTATIKSMDDVSGSLEACLRDLSSMIAANPERMVSVSKTEILPTAGVETSVTEAPSAATTSVHWETVSTSSGAVAVDNLGNDNTDGFLESLTTLMSRITDIHPFVDAADKKVLEMLTDVTDVKKVESQLNKLPRNQKELVVDEMFQLTESIREMVDETVRYRRVVPINFMGSVKKLYRYLLRLIRF